MRIGSRRIRSRTSSYSYSIPSIPLVLAIFLAQSSNGGIIPGQQSIWTSTSPGTSSVGVGGGRGHSTNNFYSYSKPDDTRTHSIPGSWSWETEEEDSPWERAEGQSQTRGFSSRQGSSIWKFKSSWAPTTTNPYNRGIGTNQYLGSSESRSNEAWWIPSTEEIADYSSHGPSEAQDRSFIGLSKKIQLPGFKVILQKTVQKSPKGNPSSGGRGRGKSKFHRGKSHPVHPPSSPPPPSSDPHETSQPAFISYGPIFGPAPPNTISTPSPTYGPIVHLPLPTPTTMRSSYTEGSSWSQVPSASYGPPTSAGSPRTQYGPPSPAPRPEPPPISLSPPSWNQYGPPPPSSNEGPSGGNNKQWESWGQGRQDYNAEPSPGGRAPSSGSGDGWTYYDDKGQGRSQTTDPPMTHFGQPMHNFGPPHSSYGQPPPIIGQSPPSIYDPKEGNFGYPTSNSNPQQGRQEYQSKPSQGHYSGSPNRNDFQLNNNASPQPGSSYNSPAPRPGAPVQNYNSPTPGSNYKAPAPPTNYGPPPRPQNQQNGWTQNQHQQNRWSPAPQGSLQHSSSENTFVSSSETPPDYPYHHVIQTGETDPANQGQVLPGQVPPRPSPVYDTNYNSPGLSKNPRLINWMPHSAKRYEDVPSIRAKTGTGGARGQTEYSTLPESWDGFVEDPEHNDLPKLTYETLLSKRSSGRGPGTKWKFETDEPSRNNGSTPRPVMMRQSNNLRKGRGIILTTTI